MYMYAEKEKCMRFGQWARVLCAKSSCLFTPARVHVGYCTTVATECKLLGHNQIFSIFYFPIDLEQ